jgi:hypothetical protein
MSIELATQAEHALSELAEGFEHWRRKRASAHEHIPAPLWGSSTLAAGDPSSHLLCDIRHRLFRPALKNYCQSQARDDIRGVTCPIRAADKPARFLSLAFGSERVNR